MMGLDRQREFTGHLRVENKLLDAPVVHVGNEEFVVGRGGDSVYPIELPQFAARRAECAEDFTVQR